MTARSVSLIVIATVTACAGAAFAQQKLGDFVTDAGYDWIIGRWVAAADEGKVEVEYKWGLDKSIVLAGLKMGDYQHRGIIMLIRAGGGRRNCGRQQGRLLEGRLDRGRRRSGLPARAYGGGRPGAEGGCRPRQSGQRHHHHCDVWRRWQRQPQHGILGKLTYKRQPAGEAIAAASTEQGGRSGDYQKLGDLVSEGGYEWMIGKWLATDDDQKYSVEYKWMLDKNAVATEVKMADFAYQGMIMYLPAREEIIQAGRRQLRRRLERHLGSGRRRRHAQDRVHWVRRHDEKDGACPREGRRRHVPGEGVRRVERLPVLRTPPDADIQTPEGLGREQVTQTRIFDGSLETLGLEAAILFPVPHHAGFRVTDVARGRS